MDFDELALYRWADDGGPPEGPAGHHKEQDHHDAVQLPDSKTGDETKPDFSQENGNIVFAKQT